MLLCVAHSFAQPQFDSTFYSRHYYPRTHTHNTQHTRARIMHTYISALAFGAEAELAAFKAKVDRDNLGIILWPQFEAQAKVGSAPHMHPSQCLSSV